MTEPMQKSLRGMAGILQILHSELKSILADELKILGGIPDGPESKRVSERVWKTCVHLQRSVRDIEDAIAQITDAAG